MLLKVRDMISPLTNYSPRAYRELCFLGWMYFILLNFWKGAFLMGWGGGGVKREGGYEADSISYLFKIEDGFTCVVNRLYKV